MKITWIRRFFQLSCFILFNAGIWNVGPWEIVIPALVSMHGNTKTVTGSLDLLQYTLSRNVIPWTAIASVLLFAVLTGRFACGWICPFGFLQDLLFKIPTPKFTLPRWTYKLKYLVLLVMVAIIPFFLSEQTWFSFCRICPAATLQARLPSLIGGGFQNVDISKIVQLSFLGVVLLFVIFALRGFCKVLLTAVPFRGPAVHNDSRRDHAESRRTRSYRIPPPGAGVLARTGLGRGGGRGRRFVGRRDPGAGRRTDRDPV